MKNKKYNILINIFRNIYGVLLFLVLFLVLAVEPWIDYHYKEKFTFFNIVYLLAGMSLWILLWLAVRYIPEKMKNFARDNSDKLLLFGSILFFSVLLYMVYNYYFITGWDSYNIMDMVWKMEEGVTFGKLDFPSAYLSKFPNNKFLCFLFLNLWRLDKRFGLIDVQTGVFGILSVQVLLLVLTGVLVYKIGYLWTRSYKTAWSMWMIFVLCMGLSPWISIPYSDAAGLIFPTLLIYLYIKIRQGKWKALKCGLFMMVTVMAYSIKPQLAIVSIAVGMVELMGLLKPSEKKRKIPWKNILLGTEGFVIMALVIQLCNASLPVTINEKRTFGMPHFLMMGLNSQTQGGYSTDDVIFTESVKKDARNKENMKKALERVKDYGVLGMAGHLTRKTLNLYADGTFAWSWEGGFYQEILPEKNTKLSPMLRSFYYYDHENYNKFRNISQTLWMLLLMGSFMFFVWRKKEPDVIEMVLMLSLTGITIFELLFEVRARYLYTYVPVFVITACIGMEKLSDRVFRES